MVPRCLSNRGVSPLTNVEMVETIVTLNNAVVGA